MSASRADEHPDLRGKIAIVTGGAGGIGKAIALRLAASGAVLVVADRRESVADTAAAIRAAGGTADHRVVDVSVAAEMRELVAAALEAHGRLDVFVNNAGTTGRPSRLVDAAPEDFALILSVNAGGTFHGLKYGLAPMLAQGSGTIVNVSSVTAVQATPELGAYSASKHAIVGLTRVAAIEGAPYGVRVNAILPGPTDTAMIAGESFAGSVPMGRVARPEEPAAVACFLASEASSFVTGEAILVDGGMAHAGRLGDRDL